MCLFTSQGTDHKVIKEDRDALMQKRAAFLLGENKEMGPEMTELITEDLKQSAKLTRAERDVITSKLEKLASRVPTDSDEWTRYWPALRVSKHLEYTCDVIKKKLAGAAVE